MSLYKKVNALVAGHVSWATLCRYAVHNLAERRTLEQELSARGLCPVRKRFLQQQMGVLMLERDALISKKERIEGRVSKFELDNCSFII